MSRDCGCCWILFPLGRVDPAAIAADEDQILAWQLDLGSELSAENIPLAHVVLVVEGTLRIGGRDSHGQPFTLRRIHSGEWWGLWSGLTGVSAATCRTTETTKVLAVPIDVWHRLVAECPALKDWLESHPQREDSAAFRPKLAERPRQDRTLLDDIDQLQASLRSAQLYDTEALQDFQLRGKRHQLVHPICGPPLVPDMSHLVRRAFR